MTADMPTQFGSQIYQGNRPGFDASAVGVLRAAGALIFGRLISSSKKPGLIGVHRQDNNNRVHGPQLWSSDYESA